MSTERKSTPAVDGGVLRRVSASSLQLAHACTRKWWYRYVAGLPDKPPSKGIERGKAGHAAIEAHLIHGTPPSDPLVRLGIERGLVPARGGPGMLVEHEISLLLSPWLASGQAELTGFVDLIERFPDRAATRVTDWKFKASLSAWATRPEELVDPEHPAGIQMLAYAAWCANRWPAVKSLEVRHVSFQTRGAPDVVQAAAALSWTEVNDAWGGVVERIVPAIQAAASETDEKKVPRALTTSPCEAYGGCPYLARCKSVAERFKVCQARAVQPKEENAMGILDKLSGAVKQTVVVGGPAVPAVVVGGPAAPKKLTYVDVLPPEANATPPLPAAAPEPAPAAEPAPEPAPAAAPEPALELIPPTAPKKRGRPPGAKNRPKGDEILVMPEPVQTPAPEPAPDRAPRTRAEGVTLCVGCTPVGPAVDSLAGYVRRLENDYLSAIGAPIVPLELSDHDSLKFGKWRAVLGELARAQPPLPGIYYAPNDPASKEYLVAEALRDGADLFVVGR